MFVFICKQDQSFVDSYQLWGKSTPCDFCNLNLWGQIAWHDEMPFRRLGYMSLDHNLLWWFLSFSFSHICSTLFWMCSNKGLTLIDINLWANIWPKLIFTDSTTVQETHWMLTKQSDIMKKRGRTELSCFVGLVLVELQFTSSLTHQQRGFQKESEAKQTHKLKIKFQNKGKKEYLVSVLAGIKCFGLKGSFHCHMAAIRLAQWETLGDPRKHWSYVQNLSSQASWKD